MLTFFSLYKFDLHKVFIAVVRHCCKNDKKHIKWISVGAIFLSLKCFQTCEDNNVDVISCCLELVRNTKIAVNIFLSKSSEFSTIEVNRKFI